MNAVLKHKEEVINDPIWNRAAAYNASLIQNKEFGIENILANISEAIEDIQAEKLIEQGDEYYDTEHYRNSQFALDITELVNSSFDLCIEKSNKSFRLDRLNRLIENLTDYRNAEFGKPLKTVKDDVQKVINTIRDWVRSKNGATFRISEIYADPVLSAKLPAKLSMMMLIDEALMRMGCSVNNHEDNFKFADKVYTPRVGSDRGRV